MDFRPWILSLLAASYLFASAGNRKILQEDSAQALPSNSSRLLLDVFPESTAQVAKTTRGNTEHSFAFTPTNSIWGEGLNEENVFHLEMKHQQNDDNSFALRIGKGGQIYSLRGPFGESVPPSSLYSPWNDEVWQFVAACLRYNSLNSLTKAGAVPAESIAQFQQQIPQNHYFVHNSGTYMMRDTEGQNVYCPMLASDLSADGRSYRTLNWGLVSLADSAHRSPLLYYSQTRDIGNGIIELTWMVHNFSVREDVVFSFLNAPWGGTRRTSLPFHYISSPSGEALPRDEIIGKPQLDPVAVEFRKTGGWKLACATQAADSPALAIVFGRDKHLEAEQAKAANGQPYCQYAQSHYRDYLASHPSYEKGREWEDWQTRPENSFRNYDVVEAIPRLHLRPGQSLFLRSFLVVNRKDQAIELAKSLVDHVDYGLAEFAPEITPMLPVRIRDQQVVDAGAVAFELFSKPVPGSMPVFLIAHAETGREVLSSDPYIFVKQEPLDLGVPQAHPHHDYYKDAVRYSMQAHHSQWKRLLGYAYVKQPEEDGYAPISTLMDSSLFPDASKFHLDLWVKAAP